MTATLRRIALLMLLTLAGLGLGGCTAMKYETTPYDNPMPAALKNLPGCRNAAPEVSKPCVVLVRAGDWQTRTGVAVDTSQAWCIDVPDGQRWFDSARVSSPLEGEPGSGMMNSVAGWKRMKDEPWFALGAAVADVDEEIGGQAVKKLEREGDCAHAFKPAGAGMLVFFANDAVAPGMHSHFYGNNAGQVWVKVTRLR